MFSITAIINWSFLSPFPIDNPSLSYYYTFNHLSHFYEYIIILDHYNYFSNYNYLRE